MLLNIIAKMKYKPVIGAFSNATYQFYLAQQSPNFNYANEKKHAKAIGLLAGNDCVNDCIFNVFCNDYGTNYSVG